MGLIAQEPTTRVSQMPNSGSPEMQQNRKFNNFNLPKQQKRI